MDVKVRKVQLIVDQVDSLPTLPVVATRVLALATSDQTSVRDLSDIIESDPSLTSRILALVNSASFGGVRAQVAADQREGLVHRGRSIRSDFHGGLSGSCRILEVVWRRRL